MLSFVYKVRGTIAVFLTLILIPTFILGGVIIDGSRVYGSKNILSEAGQMALNGALAGYDKELNAVYGLLAMEKTPEDMQGRLKEYFDETLNAQGLTVEDVSKALIYLKTVNDSFKAEAVPESQIYQSEVLEANIVDYMKIRGPVVMGEEIFSKLTECETQLQDVSNQKNAVDKQIDFEVDIQDLIEEFQKLDKLIIKEDEESWKAIAKMGESEPKASGSTEEVLDALYQDARFRYGRSIYEVLYRSTIESNSSPSTQHNDEEVTAEAFSESNMRDKVDEFCRAYSYSYNMKNLEDAFGANLELKRMYNRYDTGDIDDWADELDKDDDDYDKRHDLAESYHDIKNYINGSELLKSLDEHADMRAEVVHIRFKDIKGYMEDASEACNAMPAQIEKIREKVTELRRKYEDWKKAVEQVQDTDAKDKFLKKIENYKDFFDNENFNDTMLNELERKVKVNMDYYPKMIDVLSKQKFNNCCFINDYNRNSAFSGINSSEYNSAEYYSDFKSKGEKFFNVKMSSEGEWTTTPEGIEHEVLDRDNDDMIKTIKDYWGNTDDRDESKRQDFEVQVLKPFQDSLEGYKELFSTDVEGNIEEDFGGEYPSKWLNASRSTNSVSAHEVETDGAKEKNSKKIAKDIQGVSSEGNSMIKGLSELDLLSVAETALISCYGSEMFSYLTCDKGDKDNGYSLSNHDFKEDKYYRGQGEYITWGNPDIGNNIVKTKAIVFAIYLACNMIYAFINFYDDAAELSVIAPGPWQIVLTVGILTMISFKQTGDDLRHLWDGEDAELFKNTNSWPSMAVYHYDKRTSVLSFSYKNWLWFFMTIHGKQTLLPRIADCIEVNRVNAGEGNTLKNEYTMIKVEASVVTNTLFLQRVGALGGAEMELPEDGFVLDYKGVLGY